MKRLIGILVSLVAFSIFPLSASGESYKSEYRVDVDGDGKKELFVYSLMKNKKKYNASMDITAEEKNVLWNHEYEMTEDDLVNDLLDNEGGISVEHWVKHFFDGSLFYGAKFEKFKISKDDINSEFLEFYSERLNTPATELKELILSEKINTVFYYRASWREELIMLVYVPKLKQFIHYSAGDY